MQNYGTIPSRNQIEAAVDMLDHAEPKIVLGSFGMKEKMPQNKTDTLVFRRVLPIDANLTAVGTLAASNAPVVNPQNYLLSEGVNPSAGTITYQDVSVTLQHYGVLRKLTKKTELMYEDDVPKDMRKVVGEHMGTLAEMIQYNVVKGGTSVIFSGSANARTGVIDPITLAKFRAAARAMSNAHASVVTQRLSPGAAYGVSPVAASYLVFCHTDVIADVRNLPGFIPVEEYGSFKPAHESEVGKVEEFRICASPYFVPFVGAGSNAAGFTSVLNNGSAANVYPVLVIAEEAWGSVALKGYDAVSPTYLPASQKNHANPLGQFGYVGCDFYMAAVRLNESWMVRIEVAASAL